MHLLWGIAKENNLKSDNVLFIDSYEHIPMGIRTERWGMKTKTEKEVGLHTFVIA